MISIFISYSVRTTLGDLQPTFPAPGGHHVAPETPGPERRPAHCSARRTAAAPAPLPWADEGGRDGRRRPRTVRTRLGDLAAARRPGDVGGRHQGAVPAGPAPAGGARRRAELRLPAGRLGAAAADRVLRRRDHLRHHGGGREGRRQDPRHPPQARRDRPRHRAALRRRRPRPAAVGALRGDRLVPAGRPQVRLPADRRAGRRLRGRTAAGGPAGRARPGGRPRRQGAAGPLLRGRTARAGGDPRVRRGHRLPEGAAGALAAAAGPPRGVVRGRGHRQGRAADVGARAVRMARARTVPRRPAAAGGGPAAARRTRPAALAAAARAHPGRRRPARPGEPPFRTPAAASAGAQQRRRYALMRGAVRRPARPYWGRGSTDDHGGGTRWRRDITGKGTDRAARKRRSTAPSSRGATGCTS
ncbi:conserved hypothetical protein [Actinacidiphila bryophytorum]|uniref:Uncharacterized protein n=1 Tax=Actinacidiphila bryophytorum TaxID=1436133 RepID=A0A9W4GZV5_9ACTN|nr:conserved hypothetical protein [Actinacidiphila bryophytorum]